MTLSKCVCFSKKITEYTKKKKNLCFDKFLTQNTFISTRQFFRLTKLNIYRIQFFKIIFNLTMSRYMSKGRSLMSQKQS